MTAGTVEINATGSGTAAVAQDCSRTKGPRLWWPGGVVSSQLARDSASS